MNSSNRKLIALWVVLALILLLLVYMTWQYFGQHIEVLDEELNTNLVLPALPYSFTRINQKPVES